MDHQVDGEIYGNQQENDLAVAYVTSPGRKGLELCFGLCLPGCNWGIDSP